MNNLILMSIKTKYANQIFDGSKVFEYRRKSIGESNLNKKIIIYSSGKEKAIIGYMIVDYVLEGSLEYILKRINKNDSDSTRKYFIGSKKCYALHIKETLKFKTKITLDELRKIDKDINLPQYYRYIKNNERIYSKILGVLNENI